MCLEVERDAENSNTSYQKRAFSGLTNILPVRLSHRKSEPLDKKKKENFEHKAVFAGSK